MLPFDCAQDKLAQHDKGFYCILKSYTWRLK